MLQVYALTKEKDTLRREQSRKSDAAALLKEKDEIINQVMAEGKKLPRAFFLSCSFYVAYTLYLFVTFSGIFLPRYA